MAEILIRKEDLADLLRAMAEFLPKAEELYAFSIARISELQLYKELFTELVYMNAHVLRPNRPFLLYNKRKERLMETYTLAFETLLLFKDLGMDDSQQRTNIWNLLKLLLYKSFSYEEEN